MQNIITLFILSFFLFGCTTSFIKLEYKLTESDITQYGLSTDKNFFVDLPFRDSLKLKYTFSTHGSFRNNSFIAANQYLFVNDISGRVYCFDLENGKTKGLLIYKGSVLISPVLMKNVLVFVNSIRNTNLSEIIFYDLFNGRELHSVEIEGKVHTELLLLDDGVVVLTSTGKLIKFGFRGEYLFNKSLNSFSKSNLLLHNDKIIVCTAKGEICFFNSSSGNLIRKENICSTLLNNGLIIDNNLFISDNEGKIFKLDLENYKVIKTHKLKGEFLAPPVADKKNIFFSNLNGEISCYYLEDFSHKWTRKVGDLIQAAPLLLNNLLIVPDLKRTLLFIDSSTGNEVRRIEFEKRVKLTPLFYNNLLFIGLDDGEIYVYENL